MQANPNPSIDKHGRCEWQDDPPTGAEPIGSRDFGCLFQFGVDLKKPSGHGARTKSQVAGCKSNRDDDDRSVKWIVKREIHQHDGQSHNNTWYSVR